MWVGGALRAFYGSARLGSGVGLAEGAGVEAAVVVEEGLDGGGGGDAGEGFGEGVGEVVGDGEVEEGEEVAVAVVGVGVRGRWDDFAAEDEGVDELEEFGARTGVAEGEGVAGVVPPEEGEEEGDGLPLGGDEGGERPAEGSGVDRRLFSPSPRRRWRVGKAGPPRRSGRKVSRLAVGVGGIGGRRGLPCRGRGGAARRRRNRTGGRAAAGGIGGCPRNRLQ